MTPLTAALNGYLLKVTNATSIESLWAMHCEKMASYGFDRLLYGFTYYRTETSLGDPNDFLLLSNHSPDYTDVFVGQQLYLDAPMTRWAIDNEGVQSWRRIGARLAAGELSEAEQRVVAFNFEQGVTAGYTISFRAVSARSKGAIALTARPGLDQDAVEEIWAAHGQDIVAINNVTHLKILTLPFTGLSRKLTKRQREVLEWVGDGKTTADIAVLMGLTPPTVEKHLRLARETLNVETTAQAVLKAAFQNQMFILDL